ncbi:MAG: guanylate kinase [Bacteroidota bacterium]
MKGKLIIISAPSGAGKTTIVKELLCSDLNLEFSVSACSRKKRNNEIDGKDYYFMSVEAFKAKIANAEFVEWQEVYENHFYGTLKCEVEKIRNAGRNVIFDVDVMGALNIKKMFGDDALSIFIQPPSEEVLKQRLMSRNTEDGKDLQRRIEKAGHELSFAPDFDMIIINDQLSNAIEEAINAVENFVAKKGKS